MRVLRIQRVPDNRKYKEHQRSSHLTPRMLNLFQSRYQASGEKKEANLYYTTGDVAHASAGRPIEECFNKPFAAEIVKAGRLNK